MRREELHLGREDSGYAKPMPGHIVDEMLLGPQLKNGSRGYVNKHKKSKEEGKNPQKYSVIEEVR